MSSPVGLARAALVALLAVCSLGSLWQQARELFAPDPPPPLPSHPEIPGDDPERLRRILDACVEALGPGDVLGVVYSEQDVLQFFVSFRLAYLLYPRAVVGEGYGEGQLESRFDELRSQRPSYVLVMGAPGFRPAGAEVVAEPAPDAVLLRLAPEGSRR